MEKKLMIIIMVFALVMSKKIENVEGITCPEAVATLNPCLPFLTGASPSPTGPCCLAVDRVNQGATTREIRRQLCDCFKQASRSFGVKADKAKQIPDLCHVQVPVPIDPSIDCTKIQ
ncbi:non-specific lipid-transfer protein A-like [Mercurialis annua]|uniref:non-specific lipid-transfer protein A-like n=1 Tax=Mercurialis annua TaxID=3986 RepID=UPI0021609A43|nr:non-specific lipid-transfer protein A-like [Mercurialis annua]